MNLLRNLALSPAGSAARRAAAFSLNSFVGTWRCCWRFRIRNCLKASWSDGPSLSSASSWPLAAMRGAMRARRAAAAARAAHGRSTTVGCRTTQAPTAAGHNPNDTPLAELLLQRYMSPHAGRSGCVDASAQPAPKLAALRH